MPKLNQIVAVVNGKKSEAQKALTDIYRKCGAPELFSGLTRTYKPKDDDGERFPDENKNVVYTVEQALEDFQEVMTGLMDVIATQDYNNGDAKADVVVDGNVVLEQVPVTYLLFLEKQLTDLHTFVSKLPTLDVAEKWNRDENTGMYVSEINRTLKTKKVLQSKVLYEATENHPAQIEKWNEDVVIGEWLNTKLSGAFSGKDRKVLVERVKKLQDAVKFARETANSMEVDQVKVGEKIFNYLLG
jgi:hypothetical protein